MAPGARSSRSKVRKYREGLRERGLRPVQIWLSDVRSAEFRAEAQRQSLAVATSPHAQEDQDFIDAVSEWAPGRAPIDSQGQNGMNGRFSEQAVDPAKERSIQRTNGSVTLLDDL